MLRGKIWFRCPHCGHIFKSWDIEDSATTASIPMPCPHCGSKSHPTSLNILDVIHILTSRSSKRPEDPPIC